MPGLLMDMFPPVGSACCKAALLNSNEVYRKNCRSRVRVGQIYGKIYERENFFAVSALWDEQGRQNFCNFCAMRSFLRLSRHVILLATLGTLYLAVGCSSLKECAGTSAEGNMGSVINSPYDDFAPVLYGANQLLFTSNRNGGKSSIYRDSLTNFGEDVYTSDFLQGLFSVPELVLNPPLNTYDNDGTSSFYYDPKNNRVEMYFSSFDLAENKADADIFMCTFANGQWSQKKAVTGGINSKGWDAQPAISPDGQKLVFASDRAGGYGGVDLYMSSRRADGSWSVPVNLGTTINSRFDDITPVLATDRKLYYATQAFSADRTFDIVMSEPTGTDWTPPVALPFPINSQSDEISPGMWGDSVLFASNRPGGCGGYDLYSMRLCNDVLVRGEVLSPARFQPYDYISVRDTDGNPLKTVPVTAGHFETYVPARRTLVIRYENNCYTGEPIEQVIETPCAVEPVVIKTRFDVPDRVVRLSFDSYEIPFFVTGYYRPNTTENLEDLRLRFAYNLFGSNDSTRYIEFPDDAYTSFAAEVDRAMVEAVDAVEHEYALFEGLCNDGRGMLDITIEGFADPRGFTPVARYAGSEITDAEQSLYVRPGMAMDNQLLSTLRAYYSMLTLRSMLQHNSDYAQYRDRIRFHIKGSGVADEPVPYELQRKIVITIRPTQE